MDPELPNCARVGIAHNQQLTLKLKTKRMTLLKII
jgi:hypothetical protein